MVNQTRASTSNNQDDKELRDTIARLMREEMEKIRPKSAMTNQGGTMVRNQDGSWGKMWLRVFTKKPFYRDLVVLLMTLWLNQRMLSMSLIWKIAYDKLLSRVEISEEQFVSFFLAGLPDDIKLAVRMFKPQTLSNAYALAKLQEATNIAVRKKIRPPILSTLRVSNYSPVSHIASPRPLSLPIPNANWRNRPQRKQMTQKELKEKRVIVDKEGVDDEEEILLDCLEERSCHKEEESELLP
ncbi:hypothetical protein Tco_1411554 [Tanacetum coccineum]